MTVAMSLTRKHVYSLLFLFLFVNLFTVNGFILYDDSSEENNSTSSEEESAEGRIGRVFDLSYWLGVENWWNKGPKCGPPSTCPVTHCRFDPAVIHGYCCGCAGPFDSVPITCPGNLQCPLYSEPLCSDYNYMLDCCC